MTLADVYCRFNRARGMEVWLIVYLWLIQCIHTPDTYHVACM